MTVALRAGLESEIISMAKGFGADLAGIARIEDLKQSPSHVMSEHISDLGGVGAKQVEGKRPGIVEWPEGAKSAIVIALAHPPEKPELDWWVLGGKSSAGNTAGNKVLMSIVKELAGWLEAKAGVKCYKLPYHIEFGGVYMKDTAVLAGLGCIGRNNILVTPEFGPRQRLRVMLVDIDLEPTGPIEFDPCEDCAMPCRSACPQNAFGAQIYTQEEYGITCLPGRTGVYSRQLCNRQMDADTANQKTVAVDGQEEPVKKTMFCRACELACPVGN